MQIESHGRVMQVESHAGRESWEGSSGVNRHGVLDCKRPQRYMQAWEMGT